MPLRRSFLCSLILSPVLFRNLYAAKADIAVFKDPTCGCCDGWIAHLKANGFQSTVTEVDDAALRKLKQDRNIPSSLQACHTALTEGYVIEGHVPAAEIQRLLQERPMALGLSVPGMPAGSPGMEAARKEKYAVLLFN